MNIVARLWRNHNEALLVILLLLLTLGALNVFSASFVTAGQEMKDSYFFFKRHLLSLLVGIVIFYIMARVKYQGKMRLGATLFWIACMVLLFLVHVSGVTVNGSRRWLRLASFTLQPSELAKLAAVFLAAASLGIQTRRGRLTTIFSPALVAAAALALPVYFQPDMGTAALIIALPLVMHLVAGVAGWQWLVLLFLGGLGVTKLVMAEGYRAERIASWLNPWQYAQDQGYQAVQALLAIGSGGITGTGPGQGMGKFFYLPEAHTDFAFAVFAQEWGLGGAWFLIFLFVLLLVYGGQIVRKAPDSLSQMLALGCLLLIVGQAVGNLLMVLGVLPVIGVPLPFISYGGTSLIVNLAAMGLLLNIGRQVVAAEGVAAEEEEPPESPGQGLKEKLERKRHLRLVRH